MSEFINGFLSVWNTAAIGVVMGIVCAFVSVVGILAGLIVGIEKLADKPWSRRGL